MINRSKIAEQLEPGLHALFGMNYKTRDRQWEKIFQKNSSGRAFEEELMEAGFGAASVKPEGQSFAYDDAQELWKARYQHETVALGFQITQEAIDDNLYDSISKRLTRALAKSMAYTKDVKGAAVLNNGFSGSFLGGDGVALFSTAHPLLSGGTLANKPSTDTDLSEAAIEAALIDISKWTDDRGIPSAIMAKTLVIPPELAFVAERLFKSEKRPGTADNDPNAFRSMGLIPGGFTVNHYLSDTDAWYLLTDETDGLKMFQRKPLKTAMEGDFDTDTMRFKATERYSFGWSNWRGAYASQGG